MNLYKKAAIALGTIGLYVAGSNIAAKNNGPMAAEPSSLETIAETASNKRSDIIPVAGCIATGLIAAGLLYGTLRQRRTTPSMEKKGK